MDDRTRKILKKLDRLMRTGNKDTAKFIADEAITYFSRLKENLEKEEASMERDHRLAEVEKYLGDVFRIMGEYETALGHYTRMKELSKGLSKSRFLVDAYISMGEIYRHRGKWDQALDNFKKAEKEAKLSDYLAGEAEALRLMGYVNWRLGSFKKALEYFKRTLGLSETLGDAYLEGKTYIDLGNLENESGNLDEAQVNYNKAEKILTKEGDRYELARVYNNMGDICMKREAWAEGIKYFERCVSIARELRDQRWKGWGFFNAAECLSKSGNPEKAEEYCERAERALAGTEDKIGSAYVHLNYGIAYRFLKKFDLSEDKFKRGLGELEDLKAPSVLAWAYAEYGRMLADRGDKEGALDYLLKAVGLYRKVGAAKFVQRLTKEIASIRNA